MKAYLGAARVGMGAHAIAITCEPATVLRQPGGRVSPVFLAAGRAIAGLSGDETIAVLYPRSPRSLLAALRTAEGRGRLDATSVFMTHGLASVIAVLPAGADAAAWLDRWPALIAAGELWPLRSGVVTDGEVQYYPGGPRDAATLPRELSFEPSLPLEVVVELEQFNKNLEYLWSRAATYAPELEALVDSLLDDVEATRDAIAANLAQGNHARFQQAHYVGVANLVEVNSCLTMLNSQLASGTSPVLQSSFGVGEYSLLGIGAVARAAWRLYSHISDVFAHQNHLARLRSLAKEPPFDPAHLAPYRLDTAAWTGNDINTFAAVAEPTRKHVVYFSSRWGFHQTVQSISISWQCIAAGALPDWTLLTFSHEFLHFHLRELLDELLLDPVRGAQGVADVFNQHDARDWGESALQLLVSELRFMSMTRLLQRGEGEERGDRVVGRQAASTDVAEVNYLIRTHLRDLEEVIVHVLDYIYFYGSVDRLYVSSLWHSWALVPNVQRNLEHYLVRTLLALSSAWPAADSSGAFEDAVRRLREEFDAILIGEDHGLVREACELLVDPSSQRAIRTSFQSSFTLVKFVTRYLISVSVNETLLDDRQASDDGAYGLEPGEFTHDPVDSPVGFLLDTFASELAGQEREQVEFTTLWQYLEIT